ncbi:ATP-binding protein [Oricola indica]|jgi:DNA helicase HerA-like ATPase|uniref:ATP-binding protein n=1 Tax=Oricola indica TaxID=2872591 RepID=UPI001CBD64AD|nr:ATP-binding protein [Oricola indica]
MENTPVEAGLGLTENTHVAKRNRTEGFVVSCDGTHAVIAALAGKGDSASEDYWAVGQLITIRVGDNRTVGMLFKVDTSSGTWNKDDPNMIHIHVELVGEIVEDDRGRARFTGGISSYPHLGAVAHRIRIGDLAAIYENSDERAIPIGFLSQNNEIPALISIDSLISRHFAVVGTTGVGKSTAVTLLLRKIVETRPDVRILILDPHNEFSSAFPDLAITINDTALDLPFWLFRLEEFAEVLFRGRPPIPEEVDALRELIPLAKMQFKGNGQPSLRKTHDSTAVTSDTPVPYRISDLMNLIEDRIGMLDGRVERPFLKALKSRIDAAVNDPRYRFMFANKTIEDNITEVISTIFRVPANGRPITAFQMSGMPSEIVNSVASVLCRLAFDLAIWSKSQIQTLVVCEEAHRYIPTDKSAGFAPTRAAIARIAKEGRKYGVYLGIVSQRPGELDETILSQCNTFFSMRLGNERDQEIMRKAIAGSSRSAINFLPSLANREAIAFGQGVSTPMRMTFEKVTAAQLPGNHLMDEQVAVQNGEATVDVGDVIQKMRFPRGMHGGPDEIYDNFAAVNQPLGDAPASEQRPTLHAPGVAPSGATEPEPHDPTNRRTIPDREELARLFTEEGSLHGGRDRFTRPVPAEAPKPAPSSSGGGSARDLVNRFRK